MSPPITLVIVNWNARDHLARSLDAARQTRCPVVVVDNASTDGSSDMVRGRYPDVQLLASHTNLGFAGGVNAGVAAATSAWVLVLNPDVRVTQPAIDALHAGASEDDRIAAAGGCLVHPDGTPQWGFAVRRFPTLSSLAADLLLLDAIWPGNPATRRYHARDLDPDRDQDVDQPAAACLLVRRTAFDAIGGFDTGFHPAWWEDVDFCRRLRGAGWRIRYVADARVTHDGGISVQTLGRGPFTRIFYANMRRYVDRHFGVVPRMAFRMLLATGMLLRGLVSVLRGRWTDAKVFLSVVPTACTPRSTATYGGGRGAGRR